MTQRSGGGDTNVNPGRADDVFTECGAEAGADHHRRRLASDAASSEPRSLGLSVVSETPP